MGTVKIPRQNNVDIKAMKAENPKVKLYTRYTRDLLNATNSENTPSVSNRILHRHNMTSEIVVGSNFKMAVSSGSQRKLLQELLCDTDGMVRLMHDATASRQLQRSQVTFYAANRLYR